MVYSGCQLGHYYLERPIGAGGFSDVYEARDIHLGRRVAIKVLQTHLTQSERETFRREARILDSMDHPNIVKIIEFDIDHGISYIVMPFASNGSLLDLHPAGARVSADIVIRYVKQIASALTYIHDRGFVHLDIKPQNVLVGEDGRLLLADFGIASRIRHEGNQTAFEIVGTFNYMAPERLDDEAWPASDQYSLAALVYELLTGRALFEGHPFAVLWQHVHTLPSTRLNVPEIPRAAQEVLSKALAKNPAERFENIQEFAKALRQALHRDRKVNCTRMLLTFLPAIAASIVCARALPLAGMGLDTALSIALACLLVVPLFILPFSKSRLAAILAGSNLALAMLLYQITHSLSACWLIVFVLVSLYSLASCFILLIQLFREW